MALDGLVSYRRLTSRKGQGAIPFMVAKGHASSWQRVVLPHNEALRFLAAKALATGRAPAGSFPMDSQKGAQGPHQFHSPAYRVSGLQGIEKNQLSLSH